MGHWEEEGQAGVSGADLTGRRRFDALAEALRSLHSTLLSIVVAARAHLASHLPSRPQAAAQAHKVINTHRGRCNTPSILTHRKLSSTDLDKISTEELDKKVETTDRSKQLTKRKSLEFDEVITPSSNAEILLPKL